MKYIYFLFFSIHLFSVLVNNGNHEIEIYDAMERIITTSRTEINTNNLPASLYFKT